MFYRWNWDYAGRVYETFWCLQAADAENAKHFAYHLNEVTAITYIFGPDFCDFADCEKASLKLHKCIGDIVREILEDRRKKEDWTEFKNRKWNEYFRKPPVK